VNIHQGAKQAPNLAIDEKPEITLRASCQICHADYTTWNCMSSWPVSCLYRSQSFSIAVMYISRYCCTSSSVGLSIWGNSTGVPMTTWTGTWVTKSAALSHRVYSIKSQRLQHWVTKSAALSHKVYSTESPSLQAWVTESAALSHRVYSTDSRAFSHRTCSTESQSLQRWVTEPTALSHRAYSSESHNLQHQRKGQHAS